MRSTEPTRTLTCMEVWGGNQAADAGVSMPGLDVWVYARPHAGDEEGGDIHYVSSCATGRITRLLLADVSGHGQSAASFAVVLRDLMRRFVNYPDQKKVVRSLNRAFADQVEDGRFATAVVVSYLGPSRDCTVVNAGHPRPLLFRADEATWATLEPAEAGDDVANIPLGITESRYDQLQ
ncbi:MAG: serine/threonine-protein phosphatase, partial [Phycisphaerales bacterium]|nr:serine/threonine-protein phosphatase [Phycisphaerales bacterium]